MSSTENKQEDWRVRAEAKRKAALEIRAKNEAKRLKEAADASEQEGKKSPTAVAITPATKASNPYAKAVNPYAKSSSNKTPAKKVGTQQSPTVIAAAVTPKPSSEKKVARVIAASKPPPPPVTSLWGDCRMDLWEATCTCGGERKAPDYSCLGSHV